MPINIARVTPIIHSTAMSLQLPDQLDENCQEGPSFKKRKEKKRKALKVICPTALFSEIKITQQTPGDLFPLRE